MQQAVSSITLGIITYVVTELFNAKEVALAAGGLVALLALLVCVFVRMMCEPSPRLPLGATATERRLADAVRGAPLPAPQMIPRHLIQPAGLRDVGLNQHSDVDIDLSQIMYPLRQPPQVASMAGVMAGAGGIAGGLDPQRLRDRHATSPVDFAQARAERSPLDFAQQSSRIIGAYQYNPENNPFEHPRDESQPRVGVFSFVRGQGVKKNE